MTSRCFALVVVLFAIGQFSPAIADGPSAVQKKQPNILWIVTDDQRPDSVQAYNKAVYGREESPLGYVESPNIDSLASEGVLFTTAFTNSPVCGSSRGSMHSGRYLFRYGHYAFEQTHQGPDFMKPVVSETMRSHGYATATFGKSDHYIYRWGPGQGFFDAGFFDTRVHFKNGLQKNGIGDLFVTNRYGKIDGNPGVVGTIEKVIYPDGTTKEHFLARKDGKLTQEDIESKRQVDKEFDLLRAYTRANANLIIGGRNPKPAGETIDAYIVKEFSSYLINANTSYKNSWGQPTSGADASKPQFLHLGFHLPHSPVLPPRSFRERFSKQNYHVPQFDQENIGLFLLNSGRPIRDRW